MFAVASPWAAKLIPIPDMAAVSASLSRSAGVGLTMRLNPMAKPLRERCERGAYVGGPLLVSVLADHPIRSVLDLRRARSECDAVTPIRAAVAQRKQLGLQEVRAPQRAEMD